MKRFFYFLGWTIFIGFSIYLGVIYQHFLQQEARLTFNLMPVVLFTFIFSIGVGIILRLPKLINEIKQNKQWMFDWIKFIAIGLPSLSISLIYIFMFYLPESMTAFIPQAIFLSDPTIQLISGVVFGYILVDTLKK